MAGKGDAYRPVNQKVYDANYDAIFRKGEHEHEPTDETPEQAADEACPICGGCPCPLDDEAPDRQAALGDEAPARSGSRPEDVQRQNVE